MLFYSNIRYKTLFVLAIIKICACQSSDGTSLTSDETANGCVSFILHNSNFPNGIPVNSTSREHLDGLFKNVKCVFVTHGWTENSNKPSVMDPINALLKEDDLNLIAVDWEPLAGNILYTPAVDATKQVGEAVCALLIELDSSGICKVEEAYGIGHSLGAHVMGILGYCLQKRIQKQLARITGLDPAGPDYKGDHHPEEELLDKSDAKFVEIIHTDDVFGWALKLGHVDFWPNGGKALQPGCTLLHPFCSHRRSYLFFTESIHNRTAFPSVYCDSYDNFTSGSCEDNVSLHMGYSSEENCIRLNAPLGNYFVNTNDKSPFSQ